MAHSDVSDADDVDIDASAQHLRALLSAARTASVPARAAAILRELRLAVIAHGIPEAHALEVLRLDVITREPCSVHSVTSLA
jgi:hypothetical protein